MAHTLDRPRVAMVGLGCAKNQVDAETVLGQLSDAGYPIVSDLNEGPDHIHQYLRLYPGRQGGIHPGDPGCFHI